MLSRSALLSQQSYASSAGGLLLKQTKQASTATKRQTRAAIAAPQLYTPATTCVGALKCAQNVETAYNANIVWSTSSKGCVDRGSWLERVFSPHRGLLFGHCCYAAGSDSACSSYSGTSAYDNESMAVRVVEYERKLRPDIHTALQFGLMSYEVLVGDDGTARIVVNNNPISRKQLARRCSKDGQFDFDTPNFSDIELADELAVVQHDIDTEINLDSGLFEQKYDHLQQRYNRNSMGRHEPDRCWKLRVSPSASPAMRVRRAYEVGFVRKENIDKVQKILNCIVGSDGADSDGVPIKYHGVWNNCVQINKDMIDCLVKKGVMTRNERNYSRMCRRNLVTGLSRTERAKHHEPICTILL